MKPVIEHLKYEDLTPVPRGRGIVNYPIACKEMGAEELHAGLTRMPAHTTVPAHFHNTEEQVTILEGTMKIILNGDTEVICNKYDSTVLSPGVKHELINDTDEFLVAMVIYGSANVNRTFAETGETVDIGSEEDKFIETD